MGKQKILDDCDMKGQGDLESEDGKARVSSSFLDRRGGGETVREDANEGTKNNKKRKMMKMMTNHLHFCLPTSTVPNINFVSLISNFKILHVVPSFHLPITPGNFQARDRHVAPPAGLPCQAS